MQNISQVPQFMGARIIRREDPNLITGKGKYVGDLQPEGMLHMAVVRSPYAHARIRGIDVSAAQAMRGVVAVLTGREINAQTVLPLPMTVDVTGEGFSNGHRTDRPPLTIDKVRYVGEPVAVVVAEDPYLAADAVEAVSIDWEPLVGVSDPEKALVKGAPQLYEEWGSNQAFRWFKEGGDVNAAFAKAEKVVEVRVVNQRLIPSAMEPRGVLASYDAESDQITIWTSTQIPHSVKDEVADVIGFSRDKMRVIAPEVGGGFGAKSNVYNEEVIAPLLARMLKRPVLWVATRREDYLTTSHGRDQIDILRLAADKNGRISAADLKVIANVGAYYARPTPVIPSLTAMMMTGVYAIPNARCEAIAVVTNKGINEPYRGAGRPEAAFVIERGLDVLADELGIDPVELRRRNFIAPDQFPYTTPTGAKYDSGDYAMNLARALELVDYPALRAEQAKRLSDGNGKLLGIGLACYVEICGFGPWESGTVTVDAEGKVTVLTGTSPHGQGHQTAWAQLAASVLQIPYDDIVVKHGDTAVVKRGVGTFGSRSAPVGGAAVYRNSQTVRTRANEIAAHLLEAASADVVLQNGKFQVLGSPSASVTWKEVAKAAYATGQALPAELQGALEADDDYTPSGETYPFGTHICVVEVDPATGATEILRFVTVDDCGPVINPLLVEGQVHGGIAQGIGQALFEHAIYNDNGQLLSGTLMDYAVPRADSFPLFETNRTETPSPLNPIGVKGIGEAATIGSTPAVVNAVVDALSHLGIRNLDMPLTAEKVWQAVHG